jgi:hypothetical protein
MFTLMSPILSLLRKNIAQGASTTVYAAVHPDLKGIGGKYLDSCKIVPALAYSDDDENCKKLWELTESLTNEKYPF